MSARHPHMARLEQLHVEQRGAPQQGGAPEEQREAPRESGKRLATFPRRGGPTRPPEELRITLDTFEGHAFVGLRLWAQGSDGNFYPSRKGVSVRVGELVGVIKALCAGARELGLELRPQRPAEKSAAPTDGGRR